MSTIPENLIDLIEKVVIFTALFIIKMSSTANVQDVLLLSFWFSSDVVARCLSVLLLCEPVQYCSCEVDEEDGVLSYRELDCDGVMGPDV